MDGFWANVEPVFGQLCHLEINCIADILEGHVSLMLKVK